MACTQGVSVLEHHVSLYRDLWLQQTMEDALHVLLISDTQVSISSLPSRSTMSFSNLRTFFIDKFLKKSWHVTRHLNPHVVFFLGNMLNTGRFVKNEAQ